MIHWGAIFKLALSWSTAPRVRWWFSVLFARLIELLELVACGLLNGSENLWLHWLNGVQRGVWYLASSQQHEFVARD
jgi:hypothetical protein